MEEKYPIKEIKVMDGVYIWKPEKKSNNNTNSNTNSNTNNNSTNNTNKNIEKKDDNNNYYLGTKSSIGENEYLCHGKDELIRIYEIEFEELGNNVLSLFQSNEDMMEFDPNDYDLIQAREENLELIDKKLAEIVKIQQKMKEICEIHPLVSVDIFEYFGIGKGSDNSLGKGVNVLFYNSSNDFAVSLTTVNNDEVFLYKTNKQSCKNYCGCRGKLNSTYFGKYSNCLPI